MTIFIATFVFNLLLIAGFAALLRRNAARSDTGRASRRLIAFIIALWFGIAMASVLLALSTTTAARTAIAMRVLGTKQPFAAIRNTDPRMWERIEVAVEEGMDGKEKEGMTASIERSVRAVLQPYMNDKLAHAPDSSVVEMGRMTLASMRKASRESKADCAALSRGDEATMRRYVDEDQTGRWLEKLIRSEPVANPAVADMAEFQTRLTAQMAERGLQAGTTSGDDSVCDNAIYGIDTVLALPEADAAASLRSMGQGVRMVTR